MTDASDSSAVPDSRLARWGQAMRNAVPSQCVICQRWPSQPLCAPCVAAHAAPRQRCSQCARLLENALHLHAAHDLGEQRCGECMTHSPPWQRAWAAVDYAAPWSGLIGAFKFRSQPELARSLSQLMAQVPGVKQALMIADAVIPIPITQRELLARGYNQTDLLARQLAPRKTLLALRRVKAQTPQHRLTRSERLRSMRGAFSVVPGAPIAGRHLLVVDDVMTTGATATAASLCLLAAGAASVSVLVLARTGPPTRE